MNPIKIIIDTDIGFDLDDTWAILYAIKSKNFDVKLISISDGDLDYKVKLTAKLLKLCNREDIPIAIGKSLFETVYPQKDYVKDFDLKTYKGKIYQDYRTAYEEILKKDYCDIIELSPMSSIQDVTDIIERYGCKIYAMMGSVYYEHRGRKGIIPEYNVVSSVEGAQKVFKCSNEIYMFPLDSCGMFIMNHEIYSKMMKVKSPVIDDLKENYLLWLKNFPHASEEFAIDKTSNILFDLSTFTYLVHPDCFEIKEMRITIDNEGYTKIDNDNGKLVKVATRTIDLDKIMNEVKDVLIS